MFESFIINIADDTDSDDALINIDNEDTDSDDIFVWVTVFSPSIDTIYIHKDATGLILFVSNSFYVHTTAENIDVGQKICNIVITSVGLKVTIESSPESQSSYK